MKEKKSIVLKVHSATIGIKTIKKEEKEDGKISR